MGFNDDATWSVFRTLDPQFGTVGAGAISANWTLTGGAQTPRDYQRWGTYEAGMAITVTTLGSCLYTLQPPTQTFAFRMSWDVRVSTSLDPGGPQIIGGIVGGGGGVIYYAGPRYYPPDGGSFWWLLTPVGKWECGALTANRYYHIGIKKLGTAFSVWWDPTARAAPIGPAGDSALSQVISGSVSAGAASSAYMGFFASWAEIVNDIDFGSINNMHLEELALSPGTGGGGSGGSGGGGISGGFSLGPTTSDEASLGEVQESAAYHRYKSLRAAANTYSYLRPWS